ncbi:Late embryogenesis abundant protein [Melia azedarach]|uniref:Late embryogenesis abundant protein n=1 Tax=Melia azedarach TaxID=155640 RepID=A0ACC1Z1U7_MELAZ|nr:Late embryogenesis abundant protein [Melia azedarach]
MATVRSSRKSLKICCGVTAILLVILVIVITTLSLTIFKPKQPQITAHPIGLGNISFGGFPNVTMNVTVRMFVTIDNRNYGSFKYRNTTAYVNYRGETIGEVAIEQDLVPARGKVNITTSADLQADKLIWNPNFLSDVEAGSLNLTSTANLHGKVTVLRIFNLHARALSTCYISVWINPQKVDTKCKSKIRLV